MLAGRVGKVAWRLEQDSVRRGLGMAVASNEDLEWASDNDLPVPEHLRIVFMDVEYPTGEVHKARVKLANAVEMAQGRGTVVDIEW